MNRACLLFIFIICLWFASASCQNRSVITGGDTGTGNIPAEKIHTQPDSLQLIDFVKKHPDLAEFETELQELYRKKSYQYIWFDGKGLTEFAHAIYNKVNQISEDGIVVSIPYKEKLDTIFISRQQSPESDFLLSAVFLFYNNCVYDGLDINYSTETGWLIPRENTSYSVYTDSILKDPALFDKARLFSQYYNLRKALKKYRQIEKDGGWSTIPLPETTKKLTPGDSAATIALVRTRLFAEGYLDTNSGIATYDEPLVKAVNAYKTRHNKVPDGIINPAFIDDLNVPVSSRIKSIIVNMERCRWLSPTLNNAAGIIAVNIPSFRLHYIQDGKTVLTSKVVVGKEATKTVVFSGDMSYIAFSPYWNVPQSILQNEILPAIKKNPAYLAEHNMEWNGDMVRQKPGGNNSLGLVKFMFPNSNNIYLHDTPVKSLFNRDERAFSHGCIRVEKAKELAVAITAKDGNWTEQQVTTAMNTGKENIYRLKKKIPVYIGYFTAWADENGNTAFYEDIYNRDERLAELLYRNK